MTKVYCPCGSQIPVSAESAGFSATTITVGACGICQQAGIVSREMRKSYGIAAVMPTVTLWHRDGLVGIG